MNIQSLTYFASAAKHLSFTKAADEFLIAQPAMSKQIAGIEDELGVKLFLRHNKRVELTPAGKIFYAETQEILQRYSNAVFLTRDTHFGSNEKLSIGYGMFDSPIVSAHVKKFASAYPDVSVKLNQYYNDALIQKLEKGVCDIVFCPLNRIEHMKNIITIPVENEIISIAVNKKNPLAEKDSVTPEDLEQHVFIILSEDGAIQSKIFETFYMKAGFAPKKILYANTLSAVMVLVNAGYGLAIAPPSIKGRMEYNIKFIPLILNMNEKRIHTVVSLLSNNNQAAKNFMKISDENYRIK